MLSWQSDITRQTLIRTPPLPSEVCRTLRLISFKVIQLSKLQIRAGFEYRTSLVIGSWSLVQQSDQESGHHLKTVVGIWYPETFEIQIFLISDFKWSGFQMVMQIAMAIATTIRDPDVFVQISNGYWQMVAICSVFKWLCLRNSDPSRNQDHLQPNLFLTIWNPDYSKFQIPTVNEKVRYSVASWSDAQSTRVYFCMLPPTF